MKKIIIRKKSNYMYIMNLFKYFDPFYFFIALFLGLFMCYVTSPTPEVIVQYPTPENADKMVYKDDTGNCYKFESSEVKCPKNKKDIHKIPINVKKK